jgi:hypothetical protein
MPLKDEKTVEADKIPQKDEKKVLTENVIAPKY